MDGKASHGEHGFAWPAGPGEYPRSRQHTGREVVAATSEKIKTGWPGIDVHTGHPQNMVVVPEGRCTLVIGVLENGCPRIPLEVVRVGELQVADLGRIRAVVDAVPEAGLVTEPNDFFIQPAAIAEEIWHVAHQDRCAWSFNVELRPYGETW